MAAPVPGAESPPCSAPKTLAAARSAAAIGAAALGGLPRLLGVAASGAPGAAAFGDGRWVFQSKCPSVFSVKVNINGTFQNLCLGGLGHSLGQLLRCHAHQFGHLLRLHVVLLLPVIRGSYIYIYIKIYIYIHIYIHYTHTRTHVHTYTHAYIHTYIYLCQMPALGGADRPQRDL